MKINKKKNNTLVESGVTLQKLNKNSIPCSRLHYEAAASSHNKISVQIYGALENNFSFPARELGYKYTDSEGFLILKSFDLSLDTPVEALHYLRLGVVKYLIEHLKSHSCW